jgi:hypothetical protein
MSLISQILSLKLLFSFHCCISIAKEGTCILEHSNTLLILLGASNTHRIIYCKPTPCQGTPSVLKAKKSHDISLDIATECLFIIMHRYASNWRQVPI